MIAAVMTSNLTLDGLPAAGVEASHFPYLSDENTIQIDLEAQGRQHCS
jgi:hypothetical protein